MDYYLNKPQEMETLQFQLHDLIYPQQLETLQSMNDFSSNTQSFEGFSSPSKTNWKKYTTKKSIPKDFAKNWNNNNKDPFLLQRINNENLDSFDKKTDFEDSFFSFNKSSYSLDYKIENEFKNFLESNSEKNISDFSTSKIFQKNDNLFKHKENENFLLDNTDGNVEVNDQQFVQHKIDQMKKPEKEFRIVVKKKKRKFKKKKMKNSKRKPTKFSDSDLSLSSSDVDRYFKELKRNRRRRRRRRRRKKEKKQKHSSSKKKFPKGKVKLKKFDSDNTNGKSAGRSYHNNKDDNSKDQSRNFDSVSDLDDIRESGIDSDNSSGSDSNSNSEIIKEIKKEIKRKRKRKYSFLLDKSYKKRRKNKSKKKFKSKKNFLLNHDQNGALQSKNSKKKKHTNHDHSSSSSSNNQDLDWNKKSFQIIPNDKRGIKIIKKKRKSRGPRMNTPEFAKLIFEKWYLKNTNCKTGPYPDKDTRYRMAKKTKIPEIQVQRWFGQRRRIQKMRWKIGKIPKPIWV
ncbi:hypothetical protein M0812_10114 [Anaeramoeba flamelloides]|uniref:Homeobox domain-containing protein n=1 Tax=Anaeramoeba flamelloides TaxID=1746091 RepID=A0AAV7ZUH0_9EUKA|nr:hypothetical protein M0812_10114 [Anaeramoeba flamelloides]